MKLIKDTNGFTLIEILVTINIAAISITLLIAFYLFTVKFLSLSVNKNEKQWGNEYFFYMLDRTLKNGGGLYLALNNSSVYLITSEKDSVSFSASSINLKNLYSLEDITNLSFIIKNNNEIEFEYDNGKMVSNKLSDTTGTGPLAFDEIILSIADTASSQIFNYINPGISANKFKNIDENSL
jgi:prepilin-type N-terminal cleavage/methylation domain-containing protein